MIRFNKEARLLWIPRANADVEAKLDANYERVPGTLQWRVPPDGVVTFTRAVSALKSKMSGRLDPDDPVILARLASCAPCDALKLDEKGAWCQTCGCGSKRLMLDPTGKPADKMLFRYLDCPKFMPGFSNGP